MAQEAVRIQGNTGYPQVIFDQDEHDGHKDHDGNDDLDDEEYDGHDDHDDHAEFYDHNHNHDDDNNNLQAIILSGACGSGKTYASMVLLRQVSFRFSCFFFFTRFLLFLNSKVSRNEFQ